jgi:TetR/AcrR family transcriptional regulator, fatty acid metabolism regulator protein
MEDRAAPGRRQRQGQETKARIYDAAWHLIGEEGFDRVTVDRICSRAHVAKGSFYHHFRSKADLIVEGYSLCDKYFEEEVAGKLSAPDAPGRIVEFIGRQVAYAVDTGRDLMIQVYKSQLENGTKFFISAERRLPSILHSIVAEGQAKGELRTDLSSDYIVAYVLRFSRGMIYDWCLHSGDYDIAAVTEEACRRLVTLFEPPLH